MKLLGFLGAWVCLLRICLCAPVATSNDGSESIAYINDHEIKILHDQLKRLPGFNPIAVDNFVLILEKFRKNSPEDIMNDGLYELLSLALQGPFCDKIKIDLKQIIEFNDNEDAESLEMDKSTSNDNLEQQKWKEIEIKLAKYLTPVRLQHAMKILNAFRVGVNEQEQKEAILDMTTSSLQSLRTECKTDKSRPKI